jgi:hypothetical protein
METLNRVARAMHTPFRTVKENFQAGYYYPLAMDREMKTQSLHKLTKIVIKQVFQIQSSLI